MFQHTDTSGDTPRALGPAVASLPDWLHDLGPSEDQIRDTGWAGYPGEGYWRFDPEVPPYDGARQVLTGAWTDPVADAEAQRWTATYLVRDLTREEILARNPVPAVVTDWQFAGQAAAQGIITRAAALAWVARGEVPAVLVSAVDAMVTDPDRHFAVMLFLSGSKEYPRQHPLTPMLAPLLGMADEQGNADEEALDEFWRSAGKR